MDHFARWKRGLTLLVGIPLVLFFVLLASGLPVGALVLILDAMGYDDERIFGWLLGVVAVFILPLAAAELIPDMVSKTREDA